MVLVVSEKDIWTRFKPMDERTSLSVKELVSLLDDFPNTLILVLLECVDGAVPLLYATVNLCSLTSELLFQ